MSQRNESSRLSDRQRAERGRTLRLLIQLGGIGVLLLLAMSSRAAEPPDAQLAPVLERTEKQVASFLDDFAEVTCTEVVIQEKLRKDGKAEFTEKSSFDLLTMLSIDGESIALDESRLPQGQSQQPVTRRSKRQPHSLLVTNGFSTMLLIFHPYYRQAFEFTRMEDEVEAGGKRLQRIQFRHIKGARSATALLLRDRMYPLDLEGVAWIDPDSGMITKIEAELSGALDDLGLRVFRSEVHYAPVQVKESELWLPTSAIIEVQTPRQHWRNLHTFKDYKQFSVSTDAKVPSK